MVESSWSDPQSGVTTELGVGEVSNQDARRRRGVVPRVLPRQRNGSDQQVPVYWDQTVPVWEASRSSSKRKAPDSLSCRHGDRFRGIGGGAGGATMLTVDKTTLESSCCDHGREAFAASEVSSDLIMSMYQSALVEVCYKRSRGNHGWVSGALLLQRTKSTRHDDRRRPFAGSWSTKFSSISVLTCSEPASVRSLQAAMKSVTHQCWRPRPWQEPLQFAHELAKPASIPP